MAEHRWFPTTGGPAGEAAGGLRAPVIPQSNRDLLGVDLTHVIHTSDVASAKGSGGGKPGGGGGGGGTTFAPYTAGPGNGSLGFNITIEFKGSAWTQELHDIFVRAADFYVSLIVGELPNVSVAGFKGGPRTVDDIVITAELTNIDGAGGILGQAGPTSLRTSGSLPATAIMQFDAADVDVYNAMKLFDDIVFHEMGHSLGFGSTWDRLGLVDSFGHFTGALAKAQSELTWGSDIIYVEQDGGSGTAGSHWDEDTYQYEIMTGYIDSSNYLSAMSAASFGDLGYQLAGNYLAVASSFDLSV